MTLICKEILLNFHNFKIYFLRRDFFYSSNIHAFSQIFIQYHLMAKGEKFPTKEFCLVILVLQPQAVAK